MISGQAQAQAITTLQILDFGTIAVENYNSNVRVTILNSGGFSTNGNTYVVDSPQPGEYLVTGGPPSTSYTVTTPSAFNIFGPNGNFIIDNIRVRPASLVTDVSGEGTFQIMARIISASGTLFPDATYDDTFNLTLNF